jgi:hypothetical protein
VKSGLCNFDGVSDTPDDGGSDTPDDGGSDTPNDGGSSMPDDVITAPPDVIDPENATPIPFVTSNYVGDRSAIALDVKQIQLAINADDFQGATQIYNNGEFMKHVFRSFPPSTMAFF